MQNKLIREIKNRFFDYVPTEVVPIIVVTT